MAGVCQEYGYLKMEAYSHNKKLKEQQELIKVLLAENKKFTNERMKEDLEQKK